MEVPKNTILASNCLRCCFTLLTLWCCWVWSFHFIFIFYIFDVCVCVCVSTHDLFSHVFSPFRMNVCVVWQWFVPWNMHAIMSIAWLSLAFFIFTHSQNCQFGWRIIIYGTKRVSILLVRFTLYFFSLLFVHWIVSVCVCE